MRLKTAWMYHDIMDLYGDKGNIMTLKKRCEDRGIEFDLHTVGIGENADLSDFDLVFIGGGPIRNRRACFLICFQEKRTLPKPSMKILSFC